MNVDECQEFYRLWSAIQFAFCTPAAPGHITIELVANILHVALSCFGISVGRALAL